jgi:hypothetical protein
MKYTTRNELAGSTLKGYMNTIHYEDVVETLFAPGKTHYVEFKNGVRASVTFRPDEDRLHIGGFDQRAIEEVSKVLEDPPEPDSPDSPAEVMVGSAVISQDPNILCREDTFRYIVTLDEFRRKHENLPSWIRITTITMICKVFANERINLDKIRETFRERGSIRIRRKDSYTDGHEWKMKETTFYNQVTVGYVDQYSTKSIKVFPNGSFQVCGCSDLYDCQRVSKQLSHLLTSVLELETPLTADAFRVVMINTNFSMNKPVNQMDIIDALSKNPKFEVSFDPDRYSAVKIKFKPDVNMKKVTASVFSTGKVIVTGAETLKEIVYAYDILNTELKPHTYSADRFMTMYSSDPGVESYVAMRDLLIEVMGYYAPKKLDAVDALDQLVEAEGGASSDHMCELMGYAGQVEAELKKRVPDSYDTVTGAKFGAWVKALKERGVVSWGCSCASKFRRCCLHA